MYTLKGPFLERPDIGLCEDCGHAALKTRSNALCRCLKPEVNWETQEVMLSVPGL